MTDESSSSTGSDKKKAAYPQKLPVKPRPGADVKVDDVVRLRKPHPCGSFDWRVVRIGADIGLRCLGCDHKVELDRANFERRFKTYLEH